MVQACGEPCWRQLAWPPPASRSLQPAPSCPKPSAPDSWPDRLPWPPCSPPLQHLHLLQPSSSSSISRQIHLPPPPFPLGSAHPWRRRTFSSCLPASAQPWWQPSPLVQRILASERGRI